MKKRIAFVLTVMIISVMFAAVGIANAATEYKPDVENPSQGNVFVGISGSFESVSKAAVLNRVNEIRQEAYNEGLVPEYVPIKWSKGLEKIAQVRAAEASVLESHDRPSGKTIWSMLAYDASSFGENLAWGANAIGSINLWYSEKSDYVNHTGGVTGHYESLIDPDFTYIGIGSFKRSGTWNCVCGEFSFGTNLDEEQTGQYGSCVQLIEVPASEAGKYAGYSSNEKQDLPSVRIIKPKAGKKSITVKWKKIRNTKKTKKVQIQISPDKNFRTEVITKTKSAKKTSLKVKKLKKGRKYYVRVRAYTKSGDTIHVSKWSSKKSAKVK